MLWAHGPHPAVVASCIGRLLLSTYNNKQLGSVYRTLVSYSGFRTVPDDIVILILSFSTRSELRIVASRVCRRWRQLVKMWFDRRSRPGAVFVEPRIGSCLSFYYEYNQCVGISVCDDDILPELRRFLRETPSLVPMSWRAVHDGNDVFIQTVLPDETALLSVTDIVDHVASRHDVGIRSIKGIPHKASPQFLAAIASIQTIHTVSLSIEQWVVAAMSLRSLVNLDSVTIDFSGSTALFAAKPTALIPGHPSCRTLELNVTEQDPMSIKEPTWSRLDIANEWRSVRTLKLGSPSNWGHGQLPAVGSVLRQVEFTAIASRRLKDIPDELRTRAHAIHGTHASLSDFVQMVSMRNLRHLGLELCWLSMIPTSDREFRGALPPLESLYISYSISEFDEAVTERRKTIPEEILRTVRSLGTASLRTLWLHIKLYRSLKDGSAISKAVVIGCLQCCTHITCLRTTYSDSDGIGIGHTLTRVSMRQLGGHRRLKRLELADRVVVQDDAELMNRFPRLEFVARTNGSSRMVGMCCLKGRRMPKFFKTKRFLFSLGYQCLRSV